MILREEKTREFTCPKKERKNMYPNSMICFKERYITETENVLIGQSFSTISTASFITWNVLRNL